MNFDDLLKYGLGALALKALESVPKVLEFLKGRRKEFAEAGKITAEENNQQVETAMNIALREKDFSDRMAMYNEKLVEKYHAKQNELDKKTIECSEKDRLILKLQLELERCNDTVDKTKPVNERNRGRRDEGAPS